MISKAVDAEFSSSTIPMQWRYSLSPYMQWNSRSGTVRSTTRIFFKWQSAAENWRSHLRSWSSCSRVVGRSPITSSSTGLWVTERVYRPYSGAIKVAKISTARADLPLKSMCYHYTTISIVFIAPGGQIHPVELLAREST